MYASHTLRYIICVYKNQDLFYRNISCSRFLAVDAEGVKGLLNLLISLGSDHSYASFDLPADMDLSLILPEWAGHARKSSYFAGMVRAVNVQRILENARYQGNGRVSDRKSVV